MKIAIKKSELYKNAIEAVIKDYGNDDNDFETLIMLCDRYDLEKTSEDRKEENNGQLYV